MTRWTTRYTAQANTDLSEIWSYIAVDNQAAADKLFRELAALFEKTSVFPELGRSIDWVAPAHRILTRGNYLVIYRLLAEQRTVELVRVVHSARNWPALFDA